MERGSLKASKSSFVRRSTTSVSAPGDGNGVVMPENVSEPEVKLVEREEAI